MSERDPAQGTYQGPRREQPAGVARARGASAEVAWLVAGLVLIVVAAVGGLATAYIVATLRAAPPPDAAFLPTPTPTASPTVPATATPTVPATASPTPSPSPSPSGPTPEPTPSPSPLVYRVERGDSINKIALRFGVTPESIIELNELRNPNLIVPGQRLLIPIGSAPAASPTP